MVDVPFPLLNAPGRLPQAAGGRLINTYPEKLPATAGKPYAYWRVPGLRTWGRASPTGAIVLDEEAGGLIVNYRGALLVDTLLYAVVEDKVYTFPATGGVGTVVPGVAILGTEPVTMARNNASPVNIVIVAPNNGGYTITAGAVVNYPNGSGGYVLGSPTAVLYHRSFFFFTYLNGKTYASDPNSLNINSLNNASAESKPDQLYRPIPLGNGQLLLCGANTMEVWGGDVNTTGFAFSYISTIARGIVGIHAIAGHNDGFGKGIFFVGDDYKVSTLDGYMPVPISTPDLDLQIEREIDKSKITVSVYVSQGHGVVVVQGPQWCWEYDTTLTQWHERKSHSVEYWRGLFPVNAFGLWICGDKRSNSLAVIDGLISSEVGVNDVQTITITGTPIGGTFTLTFNGQTTGPIAYNASPSTVQTELMKLSRIGANNVDCTGPGLLPGNMVTCRFKDALADKPQPLMSATSSLTGGSAPAIAIGHPFLGAIGDPLRMRIETGPLNAFPAKIRINGIELFLTKGAGVATGLDPLETDPDISLSISRDGGQTWSPPRIVKIGRQSLTDGRVRAAIWGQAQNQGVRWRIQESAPVSFGFMGADMLLDVLR